jgi:hypothetical protein
MKSITFLIATIDALVKKGVITREEIAAKRGATLETAEAEVRT